jgi:hypothetical protein
MELIIAPHSDGVSLAGREEDGLVWIMAFSQRPSCGLSSPVEDDSPPESTCAEHRFLQAGHLC